MLQARFPLMSGLAFCLALAGHDIARSQPIEAGSSQRAVKVGGETLQVHTYRPNCAEPALLVVFHGLHRNAPGYRDYARRIANRRCLLVVSPLFDIKRFPVWRYQHGGIARDGAPSKPAEWTGSLVLALVEEVRRLEGRRMPYSLIGHSGGAQFLMRFAASQPNEAQRIVIANPGTLVWAADDVKVPYGLGGLEAPAGATEVLRRYLAQPITLYLGQDDTELEYVSQVPAAREQGANRHDRGIAVFKAAEAKAQALSLPFRWRLVEAAGVGHTARRMLARPEAVAALQP